MIKRISTLVLVTLLIFSSVACSADVTVSKSEDTSTNTVVESNATDTTLTNVAAPDEKAYIEETLNLANNSSQAWTYESSSDAWVMSIVSAVAYPELPDQQGVSVAVPGAYVTGIDTDGDQIADITENTYQDTVNGSLVIDYDASVTSTHGQVYTAATAPVILNTGAAGYGSQSNQLAATTYASEGYINIACGNRGKQDTATDTDGNTYYTGDAPSCLVDQKSAARFVKYNILLGNLPGSVDYFVSTGGSGGGAHATMFAATSNNPDFYDYQIASGTVGVYLNEDGSYATTVDINDNVVSISDGAWGTIAYSAITSLYEADLDLAFEYYLDVDYDFNTDFQKQVATYLAENYMTYINDQNLTVEESQIGFDLNNNGTLDDTIALTIDYDLEAHPDTNGYYGSYLDLYLAEFTSNLEWYLNNLSYAEGWTWFDESGNPLSDEAVIEMTSEDRALAYIEGRYDKDSSGNMGGPGMGNFTGDMPDGAMPGGDMPSGDMPDDATATTGNEMVVGTPDAGTTQSSTSSTISANYDTYEAMVTSYADDIEAIYAGDEYGNNIVTLYNPLHYIGAEGTEDPTWTRILMGASEGDMSMFASLNLQIQWLLAGVDADIAWQWNGGHVPSEILGDSFALYVDEMYGKYVDGAMTIEKQAATQVTSNGDATEPSGTDISDWVTLNADNTVSFTLADIASYRVDGASKAIPGFDVIDYGQEDYVFGNSEVDARHFNKFLLDIFNNNADVLEPLFSGS